MIFFQNCIIQRQKTYFCILGKGKSLVQSICFLKSSYFCVLHPILGKRKLIFEIFDFQLSLMAVVSRSITHYDTLSRANILSLCHETFTSSQISNLLNLNENEYTISSNEFNRLWEEIREVIYVSKSLESL